ncbi:uncharacterized protein LOC131146552 [Malania oleifera]|uniref:uncharacterized protein LOC131146552 n=1 Tax=Malania oleifera TaxID=397392 RepID=UPI0025AE61EC|nr:uncharacterized protein LOC131146552 [Malania oleifera]
MEDYPEELRTPPVSLIALVGCPELHATISTHLHSEQPPINTLALPDFSKISVLRRSPPKQATAADSPSPGILKSDWLPKHRTKVPAVVAAFFSSHHVSGDPAQWLNLSSHLDDIKTVIRGRNTKLVVVVVQSTSKDEISEDRMIALRKRAEIDSKYFVIFVQNDAFELQQSLNRLGSIFAELAIMYYRDEGRRIKTRIERKSFNSIDLNIRYCFKVAVYAEFCRDWVEALRFYEDAYHTLREMIPTRLPTIQSLVEIKTVAKQLHFKISTLLLHGGKVTEAVTWFCQHNAFYKRFTGSPEVIFLHWEWMSRQFLAFAELLETSSTAIQSILATASGIGDRPLTEWEFYPAYYYQMAAHYLKEKRSCLEVALSMSETVNDIDGSAESVIPSVYVGQYARLVEQGDAVALEPLSDEEYIRFFLTEGKSSLDSFEIIALLKKSFESYSNLKVQRMASYCGFQMAREYFAVSDFSNAKQLFDCLTSLYRQEGWVTMLWDVLGYLRECSRRQGLVKDFVEYSLEMAAIPASSAAGFQTLCFKECGPAGPASHTQREILHKEVFGLVRGELELPSSDGSGSLNVTGDSPLHLEIDPVSPLRVALLASVAFHEQMVKPGAPILITLSLLSQLPCTIEIDQLAIHFNRSDCNFIVINAQRPPLAATSNDQQAHRVETASDLALCSNKWLRLTYSIGSEQGGKLECISVVARIGPYFTICCRAESPASMDDLPLWKFEDRVENLPTKDPALAFSGQKFIQVEEPDPQVDLNLCATGPALVGESFIVPVTVISKGLPVYYGELKINLVDARGGGLVSPRELEPFSMDNHHVELLGIVGPQGEEKFQNGSESIKKIQQSFGLVSVPFLNNGDSWTCNLEIKWHQPKPVVLYVSLGYSSCKSESAAQKVHIHKSLQIEGRTAVAVSHKFMLPFRQDALLLSRIKTGPSSDRLASLPLNKRSVVVVAARNCTEVPLQLLSMSIEVDDDSIGRSCRVQCGNEELKDLALLVPGEEFKKVFCVIPEVNIPTIKMGTVHLRWRRLSGPKEQPASIMTTGVLTKHRLPDVNVESSPLVLSLDCPPHAILGEPFTFSIKIQNQTQLLQELKFSLSDSQSFVLSGSHNDTVFVLPKSEHALTYKLVPLASGSLTLPRVTLTAARYSAGFQPSIAAYNVFVFPSERHFKMAEMGGDKGLESLAAA